jgi:hypothetical protein
VSVAASTILKLRYDLTGLNFIRLPMTAAIAGHRVIGVFNSNNISNRVIAQIPGTVTTTVSGTANTNVLNTVVDTSQGPQTTTDVASSVITTTTLGAAVLMPTGLSYQVSFAVGAISGTLTQSIVRIQESSDSGINWRTVYTFEPITVAQGAKIYRSPSIAASGNRLRYSETITGTTPSITRTIFRTMSNVQGLINQDSRASSIYNTLNGAIDVAANGAIMAITALPTVATPLWLQLHDSPAAVTAGVRAFQSFRIPADGLILGFAYFGIGRQFVGMTNARIAISTTANTYTPIALAADTVQLFIESF